MQIPHWLILCLMTLTIPFGCGQLQKSSSHFNTGQIVSGIVGHPLVIFQDNQNRYWFGGAEEGVYLLQGDSLQLYTTQDGLCSHAIVGIQEDSQGRIYFDTQEGVCRYDGNQFSTLPLAEGNATDHDWKLEEGDLWFRMGWDHDGPFRYDGKYLYSLQFPTSPQEAIFKKTYPHVSFSPYGIYHLYQDRRSHLWCGTGSLGVCRFDGETVSWLYEEEMTTTPEGGSLGIRSTLEDREGNFWFTTTRFRYQIQSETLDSSGFQLTSYQKSPGVGLVPEKNGETKFPYFFSIVEDQTGDLWIASYREGVYRKQGEQLLHYPIQQDEIIGEAFAMYVDRQGVVWVTTRNLGMFQWDGDKFRRFEVGE
jgi:ligand-binding sensor domain-containing protein